MSKIAFSSIRGRLALMVGCSSLGLLLVGGIAFYGQAVDFRSLQAIYVRRVVPLQLLNTVTVSISSSIPLAINRMDNGEITADEGIRIVEMARDSINRCWTGYLSHVERPEEKAIALRTDTGMKATQEGVESVLAALKALKEANGGLLANKLGLLSGTLNQFIGPLSMQLDTLTEYQLNSANRRYVQSKGMFAWNLSANVLLLVLSIAGVSTLGVMIRSQMTGQLREILGALERLKEGDLSCHIARYPENELGKIARGIDTTMSSIGGVVRKIEDKAGALTQTSQALEKVSDDAAVRAESTSREAVLSEEAARISSREIQQINQSMGEVAGSIQGVSEVMEALHLRILDASRQCHEEAGLADSASRKAQSIQTGMDELNRTADEIGGVVSLIAKIAGQTSLLSLNATIEAARAGAAGKGFTVVAEEVKSLAKQTTSASKEIGDRIARMQSVTRTSIEDIARIAVAVIEVSKISNSVEILVEDLAKQVEETTSHAQDAHRSSNQITVSVRQTEGKLEAILGATNTLNQAAQRSNEDIERFRETAAELSGMSADLQGIVQSFKLVA
ncbi:MAG TPA: methyl-accepting chemotaxis protein [Fibrobacteria bacterium]|nr:methyl-accepting chemotaxis protein [Fibrobacteria bacterium]